MARISSDKIIEIRKSINIVDVISEYVPLTQKGRNYFGLCPFHDDHSPSMSVSPEKQIYTCFVCGAAGNVYSFLMDYEKIGFLDAVKAIAAKTNTIIDIETSNKNINNKDKELYGIYTLASKLYQNNLKINKGKNAYNYLKNRGISEEIIKEFEIGLSLRDNKIYKVLNDNKYSDKTILNSGLCNFNDDRFYDLFYDRIMFPLWNIDGQVVGFSGRIYNNEDTSKYVNSKESPIFKKGQLLYNYHKVKDYVRKAGFVIVVEGFMDVIALYKVGIKNVIATMGTAITSNQALLIKKLSPNVILMFDGDKAGNKATISCSDELLKIGIISKIVRLEDNLDPDEYLNKYGLSKLEERIENSLSLLDYKMLIFKEDKNMRNSDDVSKYIKEVINELSLVKDNIIKEITITKLSKETNVKEETLLDMLKEKDNIKQILYKPQKKEIIITNRYQKAYENLLFYMLRYKEVIRLFDESNIFIPSLEYRYLAFEIVSYYHKNDDIEINDLFTYLEDKQDIIKSLRYIMSLDLPPNYEKGEIDDYFKTLNDYTIDMEMIRLEEIYNNSINESDKTEALNKIIELKKEIQ